MVKRISIVVAAVLVSVMFLSLNDDNDHRRPKIKGKVILPKKASAKRCNTLKCRGEEPLDLNI